MSDREEQLRLRAAFVKGAELGRDCVRLRCTDARHAEMQARYVYPIKTVKPREIVLGSGLRYRVVDGVVEVYFSSWKRSDFNRNLHVQEKLRRPLPPNTDPDVTKLLELLDNPTETVEE